MLIVPSSPSTGKTVFTYFKYMEDAINALKAKNAKVIVSSQTPNNPFKDTSGTPVYVSYAQQVAQQTSVTYVDHFDYVLTRYKQLGANTVNGYFPIDNIHTSSTGGPFTPFLRVAADVLMMDDFPRYTGADVVAQALVRGIICDSSNPLAPYVKNTNVQPGTYLTDIITSEY